MVINEKRVHQYFRNFERAIAEYTHKEPLARFLTRFYKENRQMGSSDRKMTSRLCYNYFRLGYAFGANTILERLCFAEYLCESESPFVSLYAVDLTDSIDYSLADKIAILTAQYGFDVAAVFPLTDRLSDAVDESLFISSQFVQPDLYIRVKRGYLSKVTTALRNKDIDYKEVSDTTLAFPNSTRLQDVSGIGGMYEIQDLSSQYTLQYMDVQGRESWWDACAASGGKSLMLLDRYPHIRLLVSDIRLSILRNLDERFIKAAVRQDYRKKIVDLTLDMIGILGTEKFDGIILDAPCSGSGTWGRTPEMIQQFSEGKLASFSVLQRQIVTNVIPYMKSGKSLIYITCSVYKAENEDIVDYMLQNFALRLDKMELIKGYEHKADSMFVARLILDE